MYWQKFNNMIYHLHNLPSNIVGFNAIGEITEKDFSETVVPKVKARTDQNDQLNYLLVHETTVINFTVDVWMKEALMVIKHLTKWNRAAIVSDVEAIRSFTKFFSFLMLGDFKGFEHKDLGKAIDWVSGKTN